MRHGRVFDLLVWGWWNVVPLLQVALVIFVGRTSNEVTSGVSGCDFKAAGPKQWQLFEGLRSDVRMLISRPEMLICWVEMLRRWVEMLRCWVDELGCYTKCPIWNQPRRGSENGQKINR